MKKKRGKGVTNSMKCNFDAKVAHCEKLPVNVLFKGLKATNPQDECGRAG
jgi:hypothetical protein